MSNTQRDGQFARAEQALEEYFALRAAGDGSAMSFEVFVEQYPELASELRELHGLCSRVDDALEQGQAAFAEQQAETQRMLASLGPSADFERRYVVEGEVGKGGMGAVYRVVDKKLDRPLAMKVILSQVEASRSGKTPPLAPRQLARFLNEAKITGQLDHPGIVPVHEVGVDHEGRAYFTMKLVKGRTLGEVFQARAANDPEWSTARVLGVLQRVCEALAFAHDRGVIHRDLKPANVMVGDFGEVYVMDWGLARRVGEREEDAHAAGAVEEELSAQLTLTREGQLLGTPAYMSPEQANGKLERVGPPADVYAIGAMLYQLLAGHPPYCNSVERPSATAIVARILQGPPTPIERKDVPTEIGAICEKAMAREPSERYSDMQALAEDLRAYLEGRVVRAYETGAWAEGKKWVARNRALFASLTAALVLLVGAAASIAYVQAAGRRKAVELSQRNAALAVEAGNSAESARNEARLANEYAELARKREHDARWQNYVASIRSAEANLRSGNVAEAQRRLARCPEEFRQWEWNHLSLAADESLAVLQGHTGPVTSVAFSRDGTRIASGSGDSTVRVWDAETGDGLLTLTAHASVDSVAFSPDGARIASAGSDGTVRLWDAQSGEAVMTLAGHTNFVASVAFSPDGVRLASGSWDGTIRVWDTTTGETLATLESPEGRAFKAVLRDAAGVETELTQSHNAVTAIRFSPDGTRVASAHHAGFLRLWDATTGSHLAKLEGHSDVAFSPDGARLATASSLSVRVVSTATGEVLATLQGHGRDIGSVAFSPEGTRIVSGSDDQTIRLWNVATGEALATLSGHTDRVASVAFSPDGLRIASGSEDHTVRLWGAATGVLSTTSRWFACRTPQAIALSPDVQVLAATSFLGPPELWSLATGQRHATMRSSRSDSSKYSAACIVFSQDGRRLAAASNESEVHIWDVATGEELVTLKGHTGNVLSMAMAPDGTRLATESEDNSVRVWDATTGECLATLMDHASSIDSIAFSPDGSKLASGANGSVRLWGAATGETLAVLEGENAAFSPNGSLLAYSLGRTIRLREVTTGQTLELEAHNDGVVSLAFSPDGTRLASAATDETVRVWDTTSGEQLLTFDGPDQARRASVRFSPDGTVLAAARGTPKGVVVRTWVSRRSALEQARPLAIAAERRRHLDELLDPLFDKRLTLRQVVEHLESGTDLDPELRAAAIRRARFRQGPAAGELNSWAWDVVDPDLKAPRREEDTKQALEQARAAVQLVPAAALFRDTLAWALFANASYDEALIESQNALDLADEGEKAERRRYLDRLRTMIERERPDEEKSIPTSTER